MPGDRELSLKKLARAAGAKQAQLADPRDAERVTGYLVGGISPFGARRALPAFLEESLLEHERIAINAGQRGVIIELASADVARLLGRRRRRSRRRVGCAGCTSLPTPSSRRGSRARARSPACRT